MAWNKTQNDEQQSKLVLQNSEKTKKYQANANILESQLRLI